MKSIKIIFILIVAFNFSWGKPIFFGLKCKINSDNNQNKLMDTIIDLDFKKYFNNKQYVFNSSIDLTTEYSNNFIKIMNFLHDIVFNNKHEYKVLKQIYHKELIDISETYNEYHGLMINNILKADFISFINITKNYIL